MIFKRNSVCKGLEVWEVLAVVWTRENRQGGMW